MKRETIVLILFIIALSLSGLMNRFQGKQIKSLTFERDFYIHQTDSFKTKSGNYAASVQTLEGEIIDVRSVYGDKLDSLEYELGIKEKYIQDLINTTSETRIDTTIILDSTGRGSISNRWLSIGAHITPSKVRFNALIKDSITYVRYMKGKWFQKKTLTMDGISWSPYTRITGITDISIKENPNKFALVVGPGAMYYDGKIRPVLSITFGLKLLER